MKTALLSFKAGLLLLCLSIGGSATAQQASKAPLMFRSAFYSILRGTQATYSVHKAPGAGYYWTFPSSWKVVKGQGTSEITFQTDESSASGLVTVEETRSQGRRHVQIPVVLVSAKVSQPVTTPLAAFGMQVTPAVSRNHFNVQITSDNLKEAMQLRVVDILGRVVDQQSVSPNTQLQVGQSFKAGVYIVEVLQGEQKKQIKVVKQ